MIEKIINLILNRKKKVRDEKVKKAMQSINDEITWKKPGTGDEVQRIDAGKVVFDICAYCGIQITNERMFEDCPKRTPDLGHTIFKAKGEKADG